jgi:hypothetical protein
MIIAYIPLVFALLGLVLYLVSNHAKTSEVGRILYFVGALVFAWSAAGGNAVIHLGH